MAGLVSTEHLESAVDAVRSGEGCVRVFLGDPGPALGLWDERAEEITSPGLPMRQTLSLLRAGHKTNW